MFNHLAALGLGIITAVTALPAAAHDRRGPAHPASRHPSYGPPVPTYAPPPPQPRSPYPHAQSGGYAVVLSRADYNYDGWVTLPEAHAYGRLQFGRADLDRNGVLTRHELRDCRDELAHGAGRRDGVVTFDEYDANVQRQFYNLDLNRDSFLSSHELGTHAPRQASVGWSWHWSL